MIRLTMIGAAGVLACSLACAYAGSKEDVQAAAKKLTESGYSWKSTMEMANSQFTMSPTTGKYAKDGTFYVTRTFNDNTSEVYRKGEKAVVKTEDGWQTGEELRAAAQGGGGGRGFMGMFMVGSVAPTTQVETLVTGAKELKESAGTIASDLTEDGAKKLMTFGRGGRAGQNRPEPKNAKGWVKFWVKDGALVKYVYNVKGTVMGRNDEEREMDTTTTVEFKDVGTTKLEVPSEVRKKL